LLRGLAGSNAAKVAKQFRIPKYFAIFFSALDKQQDRRRGHQQNRQQYFAINWLIINFGCTKLIG